MRMKVAVTKGGEALTLRYIHRLLREGQGMADRDLEEWRRMIWLPSGISEQDTSLDSSQACTGRAVTCLLSKSTPASNRTRIAAISPLGEPLQSTAKNELLNPKEIRES